MAADISLAVTPAPRPGARPKLDLAGVIGIVAVSVLAFCSFGIIADLFVIIVVRALGAPAEAVWSAGAIGALGVLVPSIWLGYDNWLHGEDACTPDA